MHQRSQITRSCLAVCVGAVGLSAALAGQSSADIASLAERLAHEHKVCAVDYAIVEKGAVREAGAVSTCGDQEPPTADRVFQAASLGKPIFAYVVLTLVKRGSIDLDAPLMKYLPNGYRHWRNPFDFGSERRLDLVAGSQLGDVTARMVLSHSSGLPNWSRGALTFAFAPGSSWQYSGEGYMLLQQVVETVTGEPVDRLARRLVFTPLGMLSTEFKWSEGLSSRVVAGQTATGQRREAQIPVAIAPASLYTTARDYAKFLAALVNDTNAVNLSVSQPVQVSWWLGLDWGLGWGIERSAEGANLWQWGSNPGYRAFAMAAPASRNAVVVLTNSDTGMPVASAIVQAALPGEHAAFRFRMVR